MNEIVYLDPRDSVATVAKTLEKGTEIVMDGRVIVTRQTIPFAHKVAMRDIPNGDTVLKYGESIGIATEDIAAGDLVHTHNLKSNRGLGKR